MKTLSKEISQSSIKKDTYIKTFNSIESENFLENHSTNQIVTVKKIRKNKSQKNGQFIESTENKRIVLKKFVDGKLQPVILVCILINTLSMAIEHHDQVNFKIFLLVDF